MTEIWRRRTREQLMEEMMWKRHAWKDEIESRQVGEDVLVSIWCCWSCSGHPKPERTFRGSGASSIA
jgi:hypothetical protein